MFSDTHFHFKLVTQNAGYDGAAVLKTMTDHDVFFAQDIGTSCDDLPVRQELMQHVLEQLQDDTVRTKASAMIHFSAGIWPSIDAITARHEQLSVLERAIEASRTSANPLFHKISALGECGLDHHWNPSGADGRSEDQFTADIIQGERELFLMQLDLASRQRLPVIVHSRDAFDDTLGCIKESGYDTGVIHCYSYGAEEARAFLDRGWYISFSGSVTYTKKSRMDAMTELLRFVPEDRILLETDAPYLAPVPMRGKQNTPNYVEYTYKFIADIRGESVEKLCSTVDENSAKLFV